jgi:hypothetical protein
VKLLRVLQDGVFERVGDNITRKTDMRIIVATNRQLTELVEKKQFREDLYYRINVIAINMPPLRERKADIAARLPTARGVGRRLIVTVPPRHGKSLLCSTFLPAWLLGRDPTAQVISVSYGQDLATSFGRQVRNLMASEPYAAVFSAPISPDSRAVDEFRTAAGGSYIARDGGGVTGYGGDPSSSMTRTATGRRRLDLVRSGAEYYRSTLYTADAGARSCDPDAGITTTWGGSCIWGGLEVVVPGA